MPGGPACPPAEFRSAPSAAPGRRPRRGPAKRAGSRVRAPHDPGRAGRACPVSASRPTLRQIERKRCRPEPLPAIRPWAGPAASDATRRDRHRARPLRRAGRPAEACRHKTCRKRHPRGLRLRVGQTVCTRRLGMTTRTAAGSPPDGGGAGCSGFWRRLASTVERAARRGAAHAWDPAFGPRAPSAGRAVRVTDAYGPDEIAAVTMEATRRRSATKNCSPASFRRTPGGCLGRDGPEDEGADGHGRERC